MHIYKALIDSFEEYRYSLSVTFAYFLLVAIRFLKNELRHLKRVCKNRNNGTECPACPKVLYLIFNVYHLYMVVEANIHCSLVHLCILQNGKSKRILSVNGNFGLCRKKAAGTSVRSPLHEVFKPQEQVDAFVGSYRMPRSSSNKVCVETVPLRGIKATKSQSNPDRDQR